MVSYKKKLSKIKKAKNRFSELDLSSVLIHVYLTSNNVHVSASDKGGKVVCWSSSGVVGLKNNRKSTPFAAQEVAQDITRKLCKMGVSQADILVKGVSSNLDEVVRKIGAEIKINSLTEVTPIVFNGTRPKGKRRV